MYEIEESPEENKEIDEKIQKKIVLNKTKGIPSKPNAVSLLEKTADSNSFNEKGLTKKLSEESIELDRDE
ncbi:hypothetical protein HF086_018177 [Spodoptera exigua]|uniref:Uncharacterized protein n=1 Tax=Spodoptera exigua TaxID=7107 RepID=A0A922MG13_SPOEX|nr:hypothetical protein HF086_017903 [Spodoptera exigua]KAH9635923.1 hypothetical protein HF086_002483 [Spodoptera exigua]KAH9640511.1 hypothetical protein HF086_018177 [Spodoptera exigua]